jgi:hypothetical protein
LKTTTINTEEATNKRWAAQDAQRRNTNNKSHFSQAIQVQIERMKMVMNMVYACKNIYEAYGKKGVSIKVDGATVTDKKNLRLLEAEWTALGFTKKVSEQGVIYRLTA